MKILFFSHWGFFENNSSKNAWIRSLAEHLTGTGHEIAFFSPEKHKLRDFNLIHVFSRNDAETLRSISKAQAAIVLTPALAQERPPAFGLRKRGLLFLHRFLKSVHQRKWPPTDEIAWYRHGKAFLTFSPEWDRYLTCRWKVPRTRIRRIPADPFEAAKVIPAIYEEVLADSKQLLE